MAGAIETATAITAGATAAAKALEVSTDFAKTFGIASMIHQVMTPFFERSRSVVVNIQNKTSREMLSRIQCYTHCGRHEGHPLKDIGPQGRGSIKFVNGKFRVFGASGCMSLWYKEHKRVVIIYKVPQKKRNTAAIALLDENEMKTKYKNMLDADLYVYFKKPRKKIDAIDYDEIKEKSVRQLIVKDKDLGLWFECSMTGGPQAELTMTMYCKSK